MKNVAVFIGLALLAVTYVSADCYLQNPRGANDRLNGQNANRNNGNRLWDSQNNAKGGYCWGPKMYFYTGSELALQWTVQHGCGQKNLKCNMVIQYSCSDNYHDGTTTDTIPYDSENADCFDPENPNCPANERQTNDEATTGFTEREYEGETVKRYGTHESYIFYKKCDTRRRNSFLFVADQNVGNSDSPARRTRQNNNGNRRGLECPEERDYYPYWHPTPWIDIAVMVDDLDDWPGCSFYTDNSQNKKNKGECIDTTNTGASDSFQGNVDWWEDNDSFNADAYVYNTEETCEGAGYTWVERGKWGVDNVDCVKNRWSRDNHLGNVEAGYGAYETGYNWTIPDYSEDKGAPYIGENCILRVRYNISSTDYHGWETDASRNGDELSPIKNDPDVPFAPSSTEGVANLAGSQQAGSFAPVNLSLAIATNQFARTFQDRTHLFAIRERPGDISPTARIHNLNVKGKRGNIVQTYPATEYDFVPNFLHVDIGDYIHFQWTGCDTNPNGNDGEGTRQTDRSNIVFMKNNEPGANHFAHWDEPESFFDSAEQMYRFAHLNQGEEGMPHPCADYETIKNDDQNVQNCMKLNAAKKYFDGGLVKVENRHSGKTYHYMSSRNNNFTNRSQKATINANTGPLIEPWVMALVGVTMAGCIVLLVVPLGVFGPWIVTSVITGSAQKAGVV